MVGRLIPFCDSVQKLQMAFNSDKCHILHIGEQNQNFKYQLGGVDLEAVNFEMDVGVIVSNRTEGDSQVLEKVQ